MQTRLEELVDKFKEVMEEPCTEPFGTPKRICPRSCWNLGGTSVKPWWNLGEPSTEPFKTEPFGSPRGIRPREPEAPRNLKNLGGTLAHPCWNLGGTLVPQNLLAAQDGSVAEDHRHHETCATLVEPSREPLGGSTQICPREPQRVRKQFCPETFTMAEDPKAIAVGERCCAQPATGTTQLRMEKVHKLSWTSLQSDLDDQNDS